jgi:hypothetical protein
MNNPTINDSSKFSRSLEKEIKNMVPRDMANITIIGNTIFGITYNPSANKE